MRRSTRDQLVGGIVGGFIALASLLIVTTFTNGGTPAISSTIEPEMATPSPQPIPSRPYTYSPPPPGYVQPIPGPPVTAPPTNINVYFNGHSWYDDHVALSNPIVHRTPGGTGTFADPITVAVGYTYVDGRTILDFDPGMRLYVPAFRRYLIVEDACECHGRQPTGTAAMLDVWIGGRDGTRNGADDCLSLIADTWVVIKDPPPSYRVISGDIYGPPCVM